MRQYLLALPRLSRSEISRIEAFLAHDTLRTRASTRDFLKTIAKDLPGEESRFRKTTVKIAQKTFQLWILRERREPLLVSRDLWKQRVRSARLKTEAIMLTNSLRKRNGVTASDRRPIRGIAIKEIRPQWSTINLNLKAEVDERAKSAKLNLDFRVADQYFNWLLVRAIASGQIRNFIECGFCGAVKYAGIVRGDVKACSDSHRYKLLYRTKAQREEILRKRAHGGRL